MSDPLPKADLPLEGLHVSVVVLGDLGRSPRMRYQALSLAAEGAEVDLIGYRDSALSAELRNHPRIRVHSLPTPTSINPQRGWRIWLDGLLRLTGQSARLLRLLASGVPRPRVILVQNPPSAPTLAVAWLAARLRSARLVIDWHNFGATLLALKLGPRHLAVRAMARYERFLGRRANAHLCVSRAMAQELEEAWRLRDVRVLYDRPPKIFSPLPHDQQQEFLRRLDLVDTAEERPAILVSSTSWTLDEDFSLLLDAAERIDRETEQGTADRVDSSKLRFLILITGRGPLRSAFETQVDALGLRSVQIRTLWLEAEDYPRLLASADLGLCFHRSSSGLDLPMKVADMLGSGLPVCAFDYGSVLAEQLDEGTNGVLFTTAEELAGHILRLFGEFPGPHGAIEDLRGALRKRPVPQWHTGWQDEALPLFEEIQR